MSRRVFVASPSSGFWYVTERDYRKLTADIAALRRAAACFRGSSSVRRALERRVAELQAERDALDAKRRPDDG